MARAKIGFWSTLKGLIRTLSYIGQNGAMLKPGTAPICETIKQQNQQAHAEMRQYIADVDSRRESAIHDLRDDMKIDNQTLRTDMKARLDLIIELVKSTTKDS
jgi:hypothetical protein